MNYYKLLQFITESKLDDVVKKYHLGPDDRKFLEEIDPGAKLFQNKYVDWIAQNWFKLYKMDPKQLQTMLKFFKGFGRSIDSYTADQFLRETMKSINKTLMHTDSKNNPHFAIVYDDGNRKVYWMKTWTGMRHRYGNYPWCVSSSDPMPFHKYAFYLNKVILVLECDDPEHVMAADVDFQDDYHFGTYAAWDSMNEEHLSNELSTEDQVAFENAIDVMNANYVKEFQKIQSDFQQTKKAFRNAIRNDSPSEFDNFDRTLPEGMLTYLLTEPFEVNEGPLAKNGFVTILTRGYEKILSHILRNGILTNDDRLNAWMNLGTYGDKPFESLDELYQEYRDILDEGFPLPRSMKRNMFKIIGKYLMS